MPMNQAPKEAPAIIMFAMPQGKNGVLPPQLGKKKSGLPEMSEYEDDKEGCGCCEECDCPDTCEGCEGENCSECGTEEGEKPEAAEKSGKMDAIKKMLMKAVED